MKRFFAVTLLAFALSRVAATIDVQVDQPGHRVPPTLWGVFFEDINLSADGGVYPELVRNRSFNESNNLDYWKLVGDNASDAVLAIDDSQPLNPLNRTSLRIRPREPLGAGERRLLGHERCRGRGYTLRLAARTADGFEGPVTVRIVQLERPASWPRGRLRGLSGRWKQYTLGH